jgi:hypothetical protein
MDCGKTLKTGKIMWVQDRSLTLGLWNGQEECFTLSQVIGERLIKPCYLSRDGHNRKIRTTKQRTDVGKYSFVYATMKSCNQILQAY